MSFAAHLGGGPGGASGWTAISDSPASILISLPVDVATPPAPFTFYRVTTDSGGHRITDAAVLQSASTGRYVTSQAIQVDGADYTAFAATAASLTEAAMFAVYTFGITSSFWWYDPGRQQWVGLTYLASTQFGGSGVLVASGPVQSLPSLLPWPAQTSDPDWTFTPPYGWSVSPGSNLSFVDFSQADGTALPFDFTDCILDDTVLTGKSFGSAQFVRCDLSNTVLAPPLGAAPDAWIDFTGATVTYQSLGNDWRYLTLDGATITGYPAGGVSPPVNATGSKLAQARLSAWNLGRADFSQSSLLGAALSGTILEGAAFHGAVLSPPDPTTDLVDEELGGEPVPAPPTVLSGADLRDADFSAAKLRGVRFVNSRLYGKEASVAGADLREADFTGATLTGLDFRGVAGRDLTGTIFAQATLTNAQFSQTKLLGAYLTGANLEGAQLPGAQLGEVDGLAAADLSAAFMPNAVFTGANLYRVSMPYAQLYGANARLDNANLQQANLANANLAGMDLSQVQLARAVLDGTNLIGCNLAGAQLPQVSLVNASLQGVDFTGATLEGAHLANAAVALADGVVLFPLDAATYSSTLDAATVSAALRAVFQKAAYPLTDSAAVTVLTPGQAWTVQQDAPLPHEGGLGYIGFKLVIQDTGVIIVHGTMLAVTRIGDDNQLEVVTVTVQETKLVADALSDNTVCPNQRTYFENKNLELTWTEMMTSPRLPRPPDCVPSPTHWCSSAGAPPGEYRPR